MTRRRDGVPLLGELKMADKKQAPKEKKKKATKTLKEKRTDKQAAKAAKDAPGLGL